MAVVTIVDETTSGTRTDGWGMEIAEERITLRELIRRRVFQEAAELNAAGVPAVGGGLVKALPTARSLNGHRAGWSGRIDPEQQFALAVTAFSRNGFVVLVGDHQPLELDEELDLSVDTDVTFLKLVPLVGG
jgi:hypothetical protein